MKNKFESRNTSIEDKIISPAGDLRVKKVNWQSLEPTKINNY